jgi:hypothetical protein
MAKLVPKKIIKHGHFKVKHAGTDHFKQQDFLRTNLIDQVSFDDPWFKLRLF